MRIQFRDPEFFWPGIRDGKIRIRDIPDPQYCENVTFITFFPKKICFPGSVHPNNFAKMLILLLITTKILKNTICSHHPELTKYFEHIRDYRYLSEEIWFFVWNLLKIILLLSRWGRRPGGSRSSFPLTILPLTSGTSLTLLHFSLSSTQVYSTWNGIPMRVLNSVQIVDPVRIQ